jgi:hypothetical protein
VDIRIVRELSPRQRALLAFYMEAVGPRVGGVQVHRAGWWGQIAGKTWPRREFSIVQIRVPLDDGPALNLYASLGDSALESGKIVNHEHQFVCVFDSESDELVHLVAYARVHDDLAAQLDADSSFLLDEQNPLRRRGYTNVLVTRADLHAPFRDKTDVRVGDAQMRILGLVPLEPAEWQMKKELGTDALLGHFRKCGRDLLMLREPSPDPKAK